MRAGTRGKGRADGGGTIEELLQILLSTAVWVSTGSRVDREQYASDCVIHHPVLQFPHVSENRSKSARARARFCQVHLQGSWYRAPVFATWHGVAG